MQQDRNSRLQHRTERKWNGMFGYISHGAKLCPPASIYADRFEVGFSCSSCSGVWSIGSRNNTGSECPTGEQHATRSVPHAAAARFMLPRGRSRNSRTRTDGAVYQLISFNDYHLSTNSFLYASAKVFNALRLRLRLTCDKNHLYVRIINNYRLEYIVRQPNSSSRKKSRNLTLSTPIQSNLYSPDCYNDEN